MSVAPVAKVVPLSPSSTAMFSASLSAANLAALSAASSQALAKWADMEDAATMLSDEEKLTHTSEASRMSKARSAATRSSGRRAAKRESYLADAKARALASGGVWIEPTHHKALKSERQEFMEQARVESDANAMSTEELMVHVFEIDVFFAPQFVTQPRSAQSVVVLRTVERRTCQSQINALSAPWCSSRWHPTRPAPAA